LFNKNPDAFFPRPAWGKALLALDELEIVLEED
jgi:hypothetical protein